MAQGSTVFEVATEYLRDAAQRGILFMEILNERGNTYVTQSAKTARHVLTFPVEILRDGRTLERPANYVLVRIVPPNDVTIDPLKPPIVVVDPRAGHGPGIGGMKPESEIGVALRAGHPVYFIGFLPRPEPGQTIRTSPTRRGRSSGRRPAQSRGRGQANRHRQRSGRLADDDDGGDPAGPDWADHSGGLTALLLGRRGQNPMRYLGGLLGGHG